MSADGSLPSGIGPTADPTRTSSSGAGDRSVWADRRVRDSTGAVLGVTVAVVSDPTTDQAAWLVVYTGVPDATLVVAPVRGSSLLGDDIVTDATRDSALAVPPVHLDVTMKPTDHLRLSEHFRRHARRQTGLSSV